MHLGLSTNTLSRVISCLDGGNDASGVGAIDGFGVTSIAVESSEFNIIAMVTHMNNARRNPNTILSDDIILYIT